MGNGRNARWSGLLIVAVTACGGSDTNDVEPEVVPGGGVADGAIAGEVNVFVIDNTTDEPIAGATVSLGEPGETPVEAVTDSSGLAIFDGVDGPQTLTAIADGYRPATWYGANGANVTIPLGAESQAAIPQATLTGTIAGWESIPQPSDPNIAILAIVNYSQSTRLGDPANELATPNGPGGFPQNICFKNMNLDVCDWTLVVRTGSVAVGAQIVEVDNNGTPDDDTDDTATVIAYAVGRSLAVADGVDQSGVSLALIDAGDLSSAEINLDAAPPGLSERVAAIGLELGDEGLLFVAFLGGGGSTRAATVPALSGDLADARYQVIGFARNSGGDGGPTSAILARDLGDVASVDLGPWLPLAGGIDESGGVFTYDPVDGAALHGGDLRDLDGRVLWNLVFLDGRTEFSLPAIDPDPLPAADLDLSIGAFEAPIDPTDFSLDAAVTEITRLSSAVVNIR